jgi:hypothetical protein
MQKKIVRSIVVGLALVIVLSVTPALVFAQEESEGEATTTASTSLQSKLEARKAELQQKRTERLEAAKLKVCQVRQKNIQAIMARAVVRAENQVKVFSSISSRVQAFYAKKGKTLPNYDQLVAAVDDAKATLQADIAGLKAQTGFSCDEEAPKIGVELFKTALQQVNEDLKAYRTAIKNLIVGVKSVQGDEANGGTQ